MTQSMRLYKKIFTELRWKKYFTQFRCSNTIKFNWKCICVFVYMCICIFVWKNISQLNPGAATTINWKDVTPSLKAASFAAFNTESILPDKLLPLCNIHTNIFTNIHTNIFTNIQTNIEGEARRIYCIHCSLNSGRVASSFLVEQFHSTRDFCLN